MPRLIATRLQDSQDVVPKSSTVGALYFIKADTYRFHQAPVQAIRNNIQEVANKISNVQSISGPVEITVNAIEVANTAMTQLDIIDSTYLQPLSTFNTVVIGIANVCPFH